tara:strand:+ start:287 stop:643 length:357 start_codon:yes stop_codon:yes gene_type:complete
MATISLQFPSPINVSAKVGDIAYYTNPSTNAGFNVGNQLVTIGKIQSITDGGTNTTIVCEWDETTTEPTSSSFIFFGKDNAIHLSSLVGYYGEVEFKNNSKDKAELFSVGCEISESSK